MVCIALAVLSACAQLPVGSDVADDELTPAQRELRERSAAFSKTIWQ